MDLDAGNTSDPATAQARGSDTLEFEDSEDNNEPMQAGILNANDKSEEAVLTDGQTQSPPSDRDDELQGATAAIVRSHLHDEDKGTLSFDASGSAGSNAAKKFPWLESAFTSLTSDVEIPPVKPLEATAAEDSVLALQGSFREEHERLRRQLGEQWIREDRERRQGRESEMQESDVQPQQQQLAVRACSQQQLKYRKELLDPAIAECCTLPCLQKIHKECKDKLVQHGEMDSNAGNTSDPATAQARGSEDNNEPMQAGILGANDKSEEALPTDGQFQSPPSDREDELQGATAAVDASGSSEESASAVEQGINEACASLDQVHHELELIRRSVLQGQQPRRESEMQEYEVQPQQQELAVPACPQQVAQENDHCLPECCICQKLLDPAIAECCTLPCLQKIHKECKDKLVQHGEMDSNAGNTSDPATAQARGSEDNNEPMQAGILGANDKSEEAIPTDGQFQSPPSDREDELQGATAAVDASGSAEESASAVEQGINEACASLDQGHHELELIRRSVLQGQQPRRESEMQEYEVQPQQQELAVPACPQQVGPSQHCKIFDICIDQHAQENHHCLPDECCICLELLDPVFAECCTLPCLHKVHKECRDQLVQHGRSNCPLCRGPLSPPRE